LDLSPQQKRELLQKLLDRRRAKTPNADPAAASGTPVQPGEVSREHQSFELGPEYAGFAKAYQLYASLGVPNPWFRSHDGPAGATIRIGKELVNYSSYNYLDLSGDP